MSYDKQGNGKAKRGVAVARFRYAGCCSGTALNGTDLQWKCVDQKGSETMKKENNTT